jgi:hypothetical protein
MLPTFPAKMGRGRDGKRRRWGMGKESIYMMLQCNLEHDEAPKIPLYHTSILKLMYVYC